MFLDDCTCNGLISALTSIEKYRPQTTKNTFKHETEKKYCFGSSKIIVEVVDLFQR